MNNLGRRLVDRECNEYQRGDTEACNEQLCPKWTVSEWSEVGMLHTYHIPYRSFSSKVKVPQNCTQVQYLDAFHQCCSPLMAETG